ncbi:MAG: hypothetical protein HON42_01890 [Alphaproteobacteria bacterium]|nr:hypothetical protein [Alphaproteobacteria bacterium]
MVCYQYFNISHKKTIEVKYRKKEASKTELAYFLEDLKLKLDDTEFFIDEDRRVKMFQAISNIFTRNDLSSQELKTMVGIVKALYFFEAKNKIKKTNKDS